MGQDLILIGITGGALFFAYKLATKNAKPGPGSFIYSGVGAVVPGVAGTGDFFNSAGTGEQDYLGTAIANQQQAQDAAQTLPFWQSYGILLGANPDSLG